MNIFLPYENDVIKSVQSLDDLRLNKACLETKVLLDGAIAYKNGNVPNQYFKHPVGQFYKNNPEFLAYYGLVCCNEYKYRNNKKHSLDDYFCSKMPQKYLKSIKKDVDCGTTYEFEIPMGEPQFTPYYMEGSKDTPECIRTTKYVSELFQAKLIKKWLNDKKEPKWTNSCMPSFFKDYINLSHNGKDKYWQEIERIKCEVRNVNIK